MQTVKHVKNHAFAKACLNKLFTVPYFFREIVDVDRRFRRVAILVSWCERNWAEYNMSVGRRDGVKSTSPTHGYFVLSLVSLTSRDQDGGPVELNDRHLRSHGKIGTCEQSTVWKTAITSLPLGKLLTVLSCSCLAVNNFAIFARNFQARYRFRQRFLNCFLFTFRRSAL